MDSAHNEQEPQTRAEAELDGYISPPAMDFLENLALSSPVAGPPNVGESETKQAEKLSISGIPREILDKILSDVITDEVLNDRRSDGPGSNERMQRRRDICSIFLTYRKFNDAASALMRQKSRLKIHIDGHAGAFFNCQDSLQRLAARGAWNQFRIIRIALRPKHDDFYRESTENAVETLSNIWATLLNNVRVLDEMGLQAVEVYCYDGLHRVTPIPVALTILGHRLWSPKQLGKLRWILRVTGTWTPVLRFDSHLRHLEEAVPGFHP